MFKKLLSAKLNTNEVVKKNFTQFRSVKVVKNSNNELEYFEGGSYVGIEDVVTDAIKYLNKNKIESAIPLYFNKMEIFVKSDSNVQDIVEYYLKNYRDFVYGLNLFENKD